MSSQICLRCTRERERERHVLTPPTMSYYRCTKSLDDITRYMEIKGELIFRRPSFVFSESYFIGLDARCSSNREVSNSAPYHDPEKTLSKVYSENSCVLN